MTVESRSSFAAGIVSFFFNGIESGLLSIDPVRLRQNVKRRVPAALRLESPAQASGTLVGRRFCLLPTRRTLSVCSCSRASGSLVRLHWLSSSRW